jgi:predicted dehydrogenase
VSGPDACDARQAGGKRGSEREYRSSSAGRLFRRLIADWRLAREMADRVKIGIIGVGQIGTHHLEGYEKLPVEVVAAADVSEEARKRAADRFGIKRTLADFRELLEIEEIAAVDVCLHNNLHAPATIAALEAGKHVYCEKPIAGSYADGREMVATAKRTGKMLSIQLSTLFSLATKAAQRLIEGGYLGKLYYAKSVGYRRRGRPYVDGYGTSSFVQKSIAAGGAMYDMAVYHIAQVLYLLGNPAVETVTGATHQELGMYEDRRKSGKYDVEELAIGFVRLAGGISFFLEESWAVNMGEPSGSELHGSKGGVRLGPFAYYSTIADMEMDGAFHLESANTRWHRCIPETDAYDGPQQHWVAALQGRVPLIDTAGIALNTMKISEGVFMSQRVRREVTGGEIEKETKSSAAKV